MQNEQAPPNRSSTKGNYRYPGVTPFTTEQQNVFFGRDKDEEDLYRLLRREPLVVLYGKSGLGKSSLLNASIVPRCIADGTHSPLVVRFGAWTEGAEKSPLDRAKEALAKDHASPTFLSRLLPGDSSLWHAAKSRQLNGGGSPLLIFDQFEELFSYPEEQVRRFREELSELLHTGIPLRFRRMAEAADDLAEADEERLETPLDARILFAIRSDRMHLLDRLKDYLPTVLRHCFELKALQPADANDAILLPAQAAGDFKTPTFAYSPAALQTILHFLKDPQDGRIEGILLQMLCENYERQLVAAQGLHLLDTADIGDPEQVVKKYYEEKITGLPEPERLPACRLIEEGLVSEGEAMRLSLHENYIRSEYGVDKALLERLVDSRLLRSEPFLRGGYTYELSHDRLVPPVLHARSNRREEEARLETERLERERQQKLEEAQQQAEKERALREKAEVNEKRAGQQTQLAAVISVLAFVAAVVAGYFWWHANEQKATAENATAAANERLLEALQEKDQRLKGEKAQLLRSQAVYQTAGDSILLRETTQAIAEKDSLIQLNTQNIGDAYARQKQQ
ncbi:MAG: hypothetical protein KF852_02220 [Saprospiraceae bacterium]|nr:hypothetical protein [Saprospiraceae bacterium]